MTDKNKNKNIIIYALAPLALQTHASEGTSASAGIQIVNSPAILELYSHNFNFENNLFLLANPFPLQGVSEESLDDFIKTLNIFFEDLNLVNKKGYVTPSTVPIAFFPLINKFLNKLGYLGFIGNTEISIQLWLNLIIVNLYLLSILKEK